MCFFLSFFVVVVVVVGNFQVNHGGGEVSGVNNTPFTPWCEHLTKTPIGFGIHLELVSLHGNLMEKKSMPKCQLSRLSQILKKMPSNQCGPQIINLPYDAIHSKIAP